MSTESTIEGLRSAVQRAVLTLGQPAAAPTLERPKQADHGDFSTNAAMLLAKPLGRPPREIASDLVGALADELGDVLAKTEIAGPGFINLFITDDFMEAALATFEPAPRPPTGATVNIEFVSANPTGPVHLGHARNAAYGDALARILSFDGSTVTREYYVNDAGSQVANLARSIQARAKGEPVPEDGYQGEYIAEVASEIAGAANMPLDELRPIAVERMLSRIRASLDAFGVEFDVWYSEAELHSGSPSPVEHSFAVLEEHGRLFEQDQAQWVRTSDLGDDKDRVVRRSDGEYTYFASDIAYHQDKRERGFDRLIDVWGADHHGYVPRMKAAYEALGGDREQLELLTMQFVNLVSDGVKVSMSKRAGSFETLDDLIAAVGADAARWFLLNRSHDTTIEFDLDLATKQSNENPVFYVQYAHARIASILEKAGTARVTEAQDVEAWLHATEFHASERALIHHLLAFPAEVTEAATRRAPHRIATYALELAQAFTAFYRDCQVVGAEPAGTEARRLALAVASQSTLRAALTLLGVSAPDRM
ncbi:MAG TPA: arginine--tRNA ligase [Baekduia sp.]|nr:arginine--tRNA ligase [Baekduia sp.]